MKNIFQILLTIPVLSVLLSGCDLLDFSESAGSDILSIRTEKDVYNLQEDEVVNVSITNISGKTLHYNTCLSKVLDIERRNGERIDTIGLPVCYCLCLTTLKPGETVDTNIASVHLSAFVNWVELPDETSDVYVYIRYDFSFDKDGREPLPREFTRSNRFRLNEIRH